MGQVLTTNSLGECHHSQNTTTFSTTADSNITFCQTAPAGVTARGWAGFGEALPQDPNSSLKTLKACLDVPDFTCDSKDNPYGYSCSCTNNLCTCQRT